MAKSSATTTTSDLQVSGARKRGERLQIMLEPQELEIIDEWRFQKRMPSRAAAIRELLRRGLTAEGLEEPDRGRSSADYGLE